MQYIPECPSAPHRETTPSTSPSRQVGEFLVTAFSDGTLPASLSLLSGIDAAEAGAIQRTAGVAEPGNIHINCYLVQGRGRTILVDAGTGGLNGAGGLLVANLGAAGIGPDDVDTVLLTHCHPDHIGGLLNTRGQPVFKRAELYLHPLEAGYWRDDEKMKGAGERGQRNFALARRTLAACAPDVRFFDGSEIAPGINPVWLPGHTPGHTGFRIDSDEERLLIWGDIVHYPHIQLAHPAASIVFDSNPAQAEATRTALLDQVARENTLVAGMHLDQTGFARVRRANDVYHLYR